MQIAIELTGPQQERLRQVAAALNVRAEDLAAAAVRDLVDRPGADFQTAARQVLEKNRELYERLS